MQNNIKTNIWPIKRRMYSGLINCTTYPWERMEKNMRKHMVGVTNAHNPTKNLVWEDKGNPYYTVVIFSPDET